MTTVFKGTAGSTNNFGGDFLAIRKVTAGAAGVLNSISFNINAISLGIDFRAMLWTDSGGVAALLKDYSAKTTISTAGDKTLALTQGFSLTNGASYWIGIVYICSSGQITLPTDTVNTYASNVYNRQAGTVATMRDSPTLNTPPDGALTGLGASLMVWGDQAASAIVYDYPIGVASFAVAAQPLGLAYSRLLSPAAFSVNASANGVGKLAFLKKRTVFPAPPTPEDTLLPDLQEITVNSPILTKGQQE